MRVVILFVQIEYAGWKAVEEKTFEERMFPAVDYNADANQKRAFKYKVARVESRGCTMVIVIIGHGLSSYLITTRMPH